jgi:hypothetical protein
MFWGILEENLSINYNHFFILVLRGQNSVDTGIGFHRGVACEKYTKYWPNHPIHRPGG